MIKHYAVVTGVLVDGKWKVAFDHHVCAGLGIAQDAETGEWLSSDELPPQAQEDDGVFMSLVLKGLGIGGGFDETT